MDTRIREAIVTVPRKSIDNVTITVDIAVRMLLVAYSLGPVEGVPEIERRQDTLPNLLVQRLPTDLLNNPADEDVVAIRVMIIGAGLKQQRLVV